MVSVYAIVAINSNRHWSLEDSTTSVEETDGKLPMVCLCTAGQRLDLEPGRVELTVTVARGVIVIIY